MLVVGLAVLHILFSLPVAAGGGFFIIPVNPIKFEGVKIHHVYWTNKKPDAIIHSVRCYRNGRRLVPFSLGGTYTFFSPPGKEGGAYGYICGTVSVFACDNRHYKPCFGNKKEVTAQPRN